MRRFLVRAVVCSGLCLAVAAPAWSTSIAITGNTGPVSFPLTADPTSPLPASTGYTFNLNDFYPTVFPGQASPNVLPNATFVENELMSTLVLLGGFGRTGMVDPVVNDQSLTFEITGAFWRHHFTLTLDPATFPIFDSDEVDLKGFVQHLVAPHEELGEFAPGFEIPLDARLIGSRVVTLPPRFGTVTSNQAFRRELQRRNLQLPAGARFGFDVNSDIHFEGPHDDVGVALMVGKATSVVPGITREDFEWYAVGAVTNHNPVPEQPTLALLGSGILLLARQLHRQRER